MEPSRSPSPSKVIEGYLTRIHALRPNRDVDNSIPNAEIINNLYNELNNYVMKLDKKVGGVLKQHEMECLKNYKDKMYAIQKEIRQLRDKANEEENSKRKENKIKELEEHRNKLKERAEELDRLCKEQKRSLDKWKMRAEEMLDDKKFYEEQLEEAKKQQETLKLQLRNLGDGRQEETEKIFENSPPASHKASIFVTSNSPNPNYFSQVSHRLKETIGHMYSQLEAERKNLRSLKNAKTNYLLEKGELEDLFLLCVEDVKREIFARKMKASRSVTKGKKVTEKDRQVEFSEFKEIDKRKVMEVFLNSEKVRRFLYEKMFGKIAEEPITLEKNMSKSPHRILVKSRSSSKPSTSNGLLSQIFSRVQISPDNKGDNRSSSVPPDSIKKSA